MHINDYKRSKEEEDQMGKEMGARFSEGKVRHDLIPPWALDELAKVYSYGCLKYDDENYLKGLRWKKDVVGPILRHLWKWIRGQKIDKESGCHSLAMAVWGCFTLMVYEKNKIGVDDRCPYHLDLMDDSERLRRVELWKQLASKGKDQDYNGLS